MSKIKSIRRLRITTERLYNLAVQDDESYIANGVVVHNCKSTMNPNLKGAGGPDIDDDFKITDSAAKAITL